MTPRRGPAKRTPHPNLQEFAPGVTVILLPGTMGRARIACINDQGARMIGDESDLRMPRRGRERVVRSLGSCFIARRFVRDVRGARADRARAERLSAAQDVSLQELEVLGKDYRDDQPITIPQNSPSVLSARARRAGT